MGWLAWRAVCQQDPLFLWLEKDWQAQGLAISTKILELFWTQRPTPAFVVLIVAALRLMTLPRCSNCISFCLHGRLRYPSNELHRKRFTESKADRQPISFHPVPFGEIFAVLGSNAKDPELGGRLRFETLAESSAQFRLPSSLQVPHPSIVCIARIWGIGGLASNLSYYQGYNQGRWPSPLR